MGQRRFVAMASAIVVAIAGCSSEQTTTSAPSPVTPSPAASPAASPAPQAFAKPLVAQKPTNAPNAIPGLIQPTNADERAKLIQAGIVSNKTRTNPFDALPPTIAQTGLPVDSPGKAPILPQATQPGALPVISAGAFPPSRRIPSLPTPPKIETTPGTTVSRKPPSPSSSFPPVRSGSNPSQTGSSPSGSGRTPASSNSTPKPAAIPSPPSTTLASGVEVSGVVYVGGIAQAIIKAPNEQTSRYVKVGQRLSDGQVLVKRIELNSGSEPIVVLEENGVEVPKAVGEKAPGTEKPA